jgi:hypothetical protein
MVHDGNGYFEHCYAADFNPKLNEEQREACWNAWLAHYTRHQPAHRIDYAMRRVESMQAGEPSLALPGLPQPGGQLPAVTGSDSELVTVQGPRAGAEAATRLQPSVERAVANGCAALCDRYQDSCIAACAQHTTACSAGCERENAICRGGCY